MVGGEESQKMNIFLKRANLEIRRNFFTIRVIKIRNSLPGSLQNSASINAFKNGLDKFMKNKA